MNSKRIIYMILSITVILASTYLSDDYGVDKLNLPKDFVVAKVNSVPVFSEILDIESNLTITLLRIKQNDSMFYEVLTKTQEGYDFLIKYKDIILDKIIDSLILEKIAENKGINIDKDEIELFVVNYLDNVLATTNLTKEDFEKYILTQGYENIESYEKHLIFQRRTALVNLRLMDAIIGNINVSEKEIDDAISKMDSDEVDEITSVNLSHILLENQNDAAKVLQRINEVGFDQAAIEFSTDDLTKYNGGELGWIEKGIFPQFELVFQKKPGDIVGPVRTELGYHILKINDFTGGESGQENLRNDVKSQIEFEKKFELWEEWLQNEFENEKRKYKIEKYFQCQ